MTHLDEAEYLLQKALTELELTSDMYKEISEYSYIRTELTNSLLLIQTLIIEARVIEVEWEKNNPDQLQQQHDDEGGIEFTDPTFSKL